MPRLPLSAFRRRIVFHAVFVLLAVAVLLLALTLLAEEKKRSRAAYEAGFRQSLVNFAAQLRHPTGQLALLNAANGPAPGTATLTPLVLPFSALDFDDPFKARQAVEMSGCAVAWASGAQLCAAVGNSAYAGGFVYLVLQHALPPAVPREKASLDLSVASRARIVLESPAGSETWTAVFEAAADAPVQRADGGLRGRLTGFAGVVEQLELRARPERDFRGWLWQEAAMVPNSASCAPPSTEDNCPRRALLSLRVPVSAWREALFQRPPMAWPPADLGRTSVRLTWLAPGGAVLFDTTAAAATPPFALSQLTPALNPGEVLQIEKLGPAGAAGDKAKSPATPVATLRAPTTDDEPASPWLVRLVLGLPAPERLFANLTGPAAEPEQLIAEETVSTGAGTWRLRLQGDLRSVDRQLGATATRLSGFVAAMLAAIFLAWLVIELGFIRRVAVLTRRAAALSHHLQDPKASERLGALDVTDLRGRDELGILAGTLAELLQRVEDNMRREHIRAEQERQMWHAVGHEIMSPLQSLMVLHGGEADTSRRYVQRMQQAVRVLYGTASPSEAIASATLHVQSLDLDEFLHHVAANAGFAGIADVHYTRLGAPMPVQADEYPLEDAVTHVLQNAARHRTPGTAIVLALKADGAMAELRVHNQGEPIPAELAERIFEYGVSGDASDHDGQRGQGLFVARTYMAKMGGTIAAVNEDGGVSLVLRLPRV